MENDKSNSENVKYAEILEVTAKRLRKLNHKIAIGTIESIEKISKDIIEQGKDEIELDNLKEGEVPSSTNFLAYREIMEEAIDEYKLNGDGDMTKEEIDEILASIKDR